MSWAFALASRDPNLVGCVLEAMAAEAPLKPASPPEAYGIAYYQAGEALLERRPTGGQGFDLERLGLHMESDLLLAHAMPCDAGLAKDENTQPFRFRRWLFMQVGQLGLGAESAEALRTILPAFLRQQIRGDTGAELLFMHLLKHLRSRGLADGATPDSLSASVADALRDVERVLREQGNNSALQVGLFISDGRTLAVTSAGAPLSMRMIEGLVPCARCEIDERTPETHPSLRPHRRLRAVSFISGSRPGFRPLDDRTTATVSAELDVRTSPA